MNKLIFLFSFVIVLLGHNYFFSLEFEKKKKVITPVKYSKVSIQLAKLKKTRPIIKPIEDLIKPSIEKLEFKPVLIEEKTKPVFKKPLKKDATREFVKKKIKKIKKKKKLIKKKVVKRKTKKKVKKQIKEKIVKKVNLDELKLEKSIAKVPTKKIKNSSNINAIKSLKKFNKFKENYLNLLRSAIDRNKKYPRVSKRLNEQGEVIIAFRVFKSGLFKNIRVLKSSGKKRLDKAALKAVQKTGKFMVFDSSIKKSFMDITVPIKFQILK